MSLVESTAESLLLFLEAWPWLALAWIAFLGGSIGSFLNVVVYRLPRGISLSHPPSHCPVCSHPIRWHDNLPVMGWLRLRGRCRDCQAPIPARYPQVEAMVMLVFLAQWWRIDVVGASTTGELALLSRHFAWSVTVLSLMISIALIDHDAQSSQQAVPRSLTVFWLASAIAIWLAAALWPEAERFAWAPRGTSWWQEGLKLGGTLGCGAVTFVANRVGWLNTKLYPEWAAIAVGAMAGSLLGAPLGLLAIGVSVALDRWLAWRGRIRWSAILTLTAIGLANAAQAMLPH